jgi:DNA adenine methylase
LKSPLRYPGGKSRAVKHILPHFPEDIREVCSPFLGGGSVELALATRGIQVYGYDVFEPLIWFWQALLQDPEGLAREADALRKHTDYCSPKGLPKEDFAAIKEQLKNETEYSLKNAAQKRTLLRLKSS